MSSLLAEKHLIALAIAVVVFCFFSIAPRYWPQSWSRPFLYGLALLLVGNEVSYIIYRLLTGSWTVQNGLTLYICDVAAYVGAAALVSEKPLLVELTYFWAFAGTLQSLLTPDNTASLFTFGYDQFYIDHIGVIAAACFLVIGLRCYPRKGSVVRVTLLTLLFIGVDALVDIFTNSNYMYLHRKPSQSSLLNVMGPWPFYLGTVAVLAVLVFLALDSPFWKGRRREARPAAK